MTFLILFVQQYEGDTSRRILSHVVEKKCAHSQITQSVLPITKAQEAKRKSFPFGHLCLSRLMDNSADWDPEPLEPAPEPALKKRKVDSKVQLKSDFCHECK